MLSEKMLEDKRMKHLLLILCLFVFSCTWTLDGPEHDCIPEWFINPPENNTDISYYIASEMNRDKQIAVRKAKNIALSKMHDKAQEHFNSFLSREGIELDELEQEEVYPFDEYPYNDVIPHDKKFNNFNAYSKSTIQNQDNSNIEPEWYRDRPVRPRPIYRPRPVYKLQEEKVCFLNRIHKYQAFCLFSYDYRANEHMFIETICRDKRYKKLEICD